MVKRGNKKFCPRCGTQNDFQDAYCIKCGYSFRKKRKKINPVLIVILILIVAWISWRVFSNKSLFPTDIIDLIKNITANKSR